MKTRFRMVLYLLISSCHLFPQSLSDSDAASAASKVIRSEQIRAHIRFLADSLLQGRAPGTPGYDIAARYVATQLEGMGLHAAVSGSWFQQVPLEKAVTDGASSSLTFTISGKEQKSSLMRRITFSVRGSPVRQARTRTRLRAM